MLGDRTHGVIVNRPRWGRVIPYVIDGGLPDTSRVTNALSTLADKTGIVSFVPRTNQADYLRFVRDTDGLCQSDFGRLGGSHNVELSDDCHTGKVMHEVLHAIGLGHEQARCDRDSYVTVRYDRINPARHSAFDRICPPGSGGAHVSPFWTGYSDLGYEEGSIMHYSQFHFCIDPCLEPTIISLRGRGHLMGLDTLSFTDRQTVDRLYPYGIGLTSGPGLIYQDGTYTWTASAESGVTSLAMWWELSNTDQTSWEVVGDGPTLQLYIDHCAQQGYRALRVKGTGVSGNSLTFSGQSEMFSVDIIRRWLRRKGRWRQGEAVASCAAWAHHAGPLAMRGARAGLVSPFAEPS